MNTTIFENGPPIAISNLSKVVERALADAAEGKRSYIFADSKSMQRRLRALIQGKPGADLIGVFVWGDAEEES